MTFRTVLHLSLVLLGALTSEGKLPLLAGLNRCSIKLPPDQLNACMTKSGNDGIPILSKGNREYKLPSLDPMKIDKIVVDQSVGSVGLNLILIDAVATGFKDTMMKNVNFDLASKTVTYEAFIPRLEILSTYNMSGRILLLPISGQGKCNMTLDNVNEKYVYEYKFVKDKDGEYYLIPQPHKSFDLTTTRMYLHFDNLFNGDKLLGDNTNNFLNENWAEVLDSVKHIFEATISEIIESTQLKVFSAVPFKDAFLDSEDFKFD